MSGWWQEIPGLADDVPAAWDSSWDAYRSREESSRPALEAAELEAMRLKQYRDIGDWQEGVRRYVPPRGNFLDALPAWSFAMPLPLAFAAGSAFTGVDQYRGLSGVPGTRSGLGSEASDSFSDHAMAADDALAVGERAEADREWTLAEDAWRDMTPTEKLHGQAIYLDIGDRIRAAIPVRKRVEEIKAREAAERNSIFGWISAAGDYATGGFLGPRDASKSPRDASGLECAQLLATSDSDLPSGWAVAAKRECEKKAPKAVCGALPGPLGWVCRNPGKAVGVAAGGALGLWLLGKAVSGYAYGRGRSV